MSIANKIVNLKELEDYIGQQKSQGNKIVLCQGHFNVINPVDLRFLEFAKDQGQSLIVAIQGNNFLKGKNMKLFFDAYERAKDVASLFNVDKVIIYNEQPISYIIDTIKPDIYVKGEEYNYNLNRQKDIKLVQEYGGKIVFSPSHIRYNSIDYLERDSHRLEDKNRNLFYSAIEKQKIPFKKIEKYIKNFKNLNIMIIGDSIVDEYIVCDALGMSTEAPVLNIRELEKKTYVGGAAVVARHSKALGSNTYFASVLGIDEPGKFIETELNNDRINAKLVWDNNRQTTFKIRYLVKMQKILRVSRLQENPITNKIEQELLNYILKIAPTLDGIIISDFNYGVITPNLITKIIKISQPNNIKLFGNSQSSSQIGDVSKFINFDLITSTEREARIALGDKHNDLEKVCMALLNKTNTKNLVTTLAENGFIAYQKITDEPNSSTIPVIKRQNFPALAVNPKDVMGAGDALLTAFALSLCSGASLMEASIIASGIASIAVNNTGNVPISRDELEKWIQSVNTQ